MRYRKPLDGRPWISPDWKDNDTMRVYMKEIAQYSLITRQEEAELAGRIAQGDQEARVALINCNLRLVVKIAHDFAGQGLPLLDLISEGNIGLVRAVEKFNPSKGAKFSTYSAWWIKQSIKRALANQKRTVRIPVQSAVILGRMRTATATLEGRLEREATIKEIAEYTGLTERTIAGYKTVGRVTNSVYDQITGKDGSFEEEHGEEDPRFEEIEREDLRRMLTPEFFVKYLDERETVILRLRFGLNGERARTLEETARVVRRTRERIRQIQNHALEKLRKVFERELEPVRIPQQKYTESAKLKSPENYEAKKLEIKPEVLIPAEQPVAVERKEAITGNLSDLVLNNALSLYASI